MSGSVVSSGSMSWPPSVERSMTENAQSQDEATLVRRVARGDVAAFEAVYRRYRLRVAGFAGRLTRHPDIIEEVVNDTMVVVWQKAGRFRGRSRLSTWILGIAYRTTLKRLRQRSRRARAEAELPYEAQQNEVEPCATGSTPRPPASRSPGALRSPRHDPPLAAG